MEVFTMENNTTNNTERLTVKVRGWYDLTPGERENVEFLCELRDEYEKNVEHYEDNKDYQRITGRIKTKKALLKAEIEELEEAEKQAKYIEALLEDNDIYFVQEEDRFYEWSDDAFRWFVSTPAAFRAAFVLQDKQLYTTLLGKLREKNRIYKSAEYTYETDATTLNLLKTDHWLQPIKNDELNPWFDAMLNALGKGEQEIKDHIEQLIWYKYKHPEDFEIPCLIIFGEGGIGKNKLLVEGILKTIYGEHQVSIVDYSRVGGQFNESVKGKVVVFIDEATSKKTEANVLKHLVGNKTININAKHLKPQDCRNTAWYIAGGNDKTGVLLLDGTSSDRRWSIIRVKKGQDIMYWVQKVMNCDTREDAIKLFFENDNVYKGKEEVAKFLGYLESKWGDISKPEALRSDDYQELLDFQKDTFTCFCDWLFDEKFTWLSGKSIYRLYETYVLSYGDSYERRNKVLGKNNVFWGMINQYLEDKNIKRGRIKYRKNRVLTSTTGYFYTTRDVASFSVDTEEPIDNYVVNSKVENWELIDRDTQVEPEQSNLIDEFEERLEGKS